MRVPFIGHAVVPLVLALGKWFQPPAVFAVILTITLVAALRRAERLKTWRQWPVVVIVLGVGLTIALAFLVGVQWLVKIGLA